MPWECEYPFADAQRHLDGLGLKTRGKVDRKLGLLRRYGFRLPAEHTENLGGGLYELKVEGIDAQRVFYAFLKDRVAVLHVAKKGGGARQGKHAQDHDIELARARLDGLRRQA
jgi:phage-related protein